LIIKLKRAFAPDLIGREQACGICEIPLVTGAVQGEILEHDVNPACPSCIEYLGRRNPEQNPSIEEYEEANRRYPEPVYASVEEILHLEDIDDSSVHDAYRASWLSRA
jgi:hypothetical protein